MKYCKNCGNQLDDKAVICPKCGVQQEAEKPAVNDNGNFGWFCLGFCIPLAGLILFLVWNKERPNDAKTAGIGALVSVLLLVVYYVLIFAFGISLSLI